MIKNKKHIIIITPENTYDHERIDEFVWASINVKGKDLFGVTEYEMRKAVENALENGYRVITE